MHGGLKMLEKSVGGKEKEVPWKTESSSFICKFDKWSDEATMNDEGVLLIPQQLGILLVCIIIRLCNVFIYIKV